jgi:hypothetical protein
MNLKSITGQLGFAALAAFVVCGCSRSPKEPPITGKRTDPAVEMRPKWEAGSRYVYRVDSTINMEVPRRNNPSMMIRAEVTVGQDIAFTVTNVTTDGGRSLEMELLGVQMETAADDQVKLSFDSGNSAYITDESALTERLQKLVGLKMGFRLSPDNKVSRVDGTKELSSRLSGSSNVKGVAGGILNRFFSTQFFRELIEMGMLPRDAVRIGDKWKVSRSVGGGMWGTSALLDTTHTLRGWQQHDGTNCARIDFEGFFKTNNPTNAAAAPAATTNQSTVRRVVQMANAPNIEEGTLKGRSWFEPGIAMPVDTIYEQSITTKTTTSRRPRPRPGSNIVDVTQAQTSTNPPPVTNAPPPGPAVTITASTTTRQYTTFKLVEIGQGRAPVTTETNAPVAPE